MGKLKVKSSCESFQEAIPSLKPAGFSHHNPTSRRINSLSSAFTTSTMSSFSLSAEPEENPNDLPKGPISSARFFFSPCTTKSIMEEAKAETDVLKMSPLGDPWPETGATAGVEKASFHEESVALSMASDDPYHDFRASMEEMVEAHQLREWPRLQELLHCYLRLNEKKNHKIIVMAFVDLLVQLVSQDKEGFSACFPTLATTT
ncbi:transcription repressor OFP13-like [Phoenix dactylifera]|uniref:Transcription repressor n=1 Tax=Phoenix dactylifera TaxID=42345 RepID=A0A8B8ZTA4_PHODC|nr:transcription repressor OFP13-like [Phoenix dactylifera]